MHQYVKLSMKEFSLNPLHYVSFPGYSFNCRLMSSGVTLDTLEDNQILDNFVEAKGGGIYGIKGDRYVNSIESERHNWYTYANNIYGYAMMQKLPYWDFIYTTKSPEEIKDTPDDCDHGHYIICDVNYNDIYKD